MPPSCSTTGAVDLLAAAHQSQADLLLRQQLADRQKNGDRDDAYHHQSQHRLLDDGRHQREQSSKQSRNELHEVEPQETNQPIDTAKDLAVQGPDFLALHGRQRNARQVRHQLEAHVPVDACAGVGHQVAAHRTLRDSRSRYAAPIRAKVPMPPGGRASPWTVLPACRAGRRRPAGPGTGPGRCCRRW